MTEFYQESVVKTIEYGIRLLEIISCGEGGLLRCCIAMHFKPTCSRGYNIIHARP